MKWVIIFFFLCSSMLYGQNNFFSIDAGVLYLPEVMNDYSLTYSNLIITESNQDYYVGERRMIEADYTQTFSSSFGYFFQANIHFPLSKRLTIKTGLGLGYSVFERSEEQGEIRIGELLAIDTVFRNSVNGGPESCNCFTNSHLDVGVEIDAPTYDVLQLSIPLGLEYELIQNSVYFGLGVLFQTPLHARFRQDFTSIKRETVNGKTTCTFVLDRQENTVDNGIANLVINIRPEVRIRMTPQMSALVAVNYPLQPIWQNNTTPFFSETPSEEYRPLQINAGINYRFGGVENADTL